MKLLLSLLFLLPFIAHTQQCVLKDEKDQFNQDSRLTTGFKTFGAGHNQFMVSVSADKREVDVFFALSGSAACFDDLSRVMLVYEGGRQKGNFRNGGTRNCKGYFHFIFRNQETMPVALKNLSERKVISMQFISSDQSKKDFTLSEPDQELFKQMINCVLKELAALRTDTWKPGQ